MTRAEISSISPFFIVSHVPSSLSFYRDRLGFEITFQGPAPDDIFFGIVRRGGAQILLKDVGVADRKSTRLNSSHLVISYAVFCLKKQTMSSSLAVTVI